MTAAEDWDAVFRPRRMSLIGIGCALAMVIAGIFVALTLRDESTGPALRTADQYAMLGLALLLAGGCLLLTRPRLRVGPAGLGVRNVVEERVISWSDVVDVSFPKRWPRVELAGYEYVPVVAVQSLDGERAVAAMNTIREAMARYRA